jgi:phage-related protein
VAADVIIRFIGDAASLLDAADQSAEALQGVGESAGGEGSGGHGLMLAGGMALGVTAVVALGKALFDLGMAASDQQLAADQLANQIQKMGADTGDWQDKIAAVQEAGKKFGFDDEETTAALSTIISRTGDVDTAVQAVGAAFDLARQKNTDLGEAADAVAKAYDGQTRGLVALIGSAADGVSGIDAITAAQTAAAGAGDIWAASATGSAALVQQGFNDVGESIGAAVLPALQELLPALLPIIEAFGELVKTILPVVTPLLSAAAGFIADALGAMKDLAPLLLSAFKDAQPWIQGVHDILAQLADTVIPPLVDTAKKLWDIFGKIVDVFSSIVEGAIKVITKIGEIAGAIGDALGKLQNFLQQLNPLNGFSFEFKIPGLNMAGPTSYITINTGADPRAVVSAVRTWASSNGGLAAIEGPGA